MSKSGGLMLGDIDMGDSNDIINLRDPTQDKSAVPKKWVEDRFYGKNQHVLLPSSNPTNGKYAISKKYADDRYVGKNHHKASSLSWGYKGVSTAAVKYYAYATDGIPPSWSTDTVNINMNLNLESITIKSNASTLKDITDVLIELILWTAIPGKDVQNNDTGNYTLKKKLCWEQYIYLSYQQPIFLQLIHQMEEVLQLTYFAVIVNFT